LKNYDFSKIQSCYDILDDMTKQYRHANRSGVIRFSTSETQSNVADVAAPMYVVRQRYFITLVALSQPKGSYLKKI
jgi:hypothetical protein